VEALFYIGIIVGLIVLGGLLRYTVFSPMPRTITSLQDAEKLVDYQVRAANRRLRREAWMLTFVVSHFDPETRTVSVRLGINYGRRGYPDYVGRFQQMWANAQVMLRAKEKIADAFARRAFRATVETFT
jgi:hypothetical protein